VTYFLLFVFMTVCYTIVRPSAVDLHRLYRQTGWANRSYELAEDIDYLARFPQEAVARHVGLSVRAWRSLVKGVAEPQPSTARRIRLLGADYRNRRTY